MLKLDLQKKPYWLELPAGIRVKVRPFTSALMNAAQLSVKKQIEALRDEHQLRREAGADLSDMPDIEDEDTRFGWSESMLVKAVARAAIIEWEGVLKPEADEPAPITKQTVSELMDVWFVAQEFWQKYSASLSRLEAEGNSSRLAANGTSGAGHHTALDVLPTISPAVEESQTP